jgi:hypothetical protein
LLVGSLIDRDVVSVRVCARRFVLETGLLARLGHDRGLAAGRARTELVVEPSSREVTVELDAGAGEPADVGAQPSTACGEARRDGMESLLGLVGVALVQGRLAQLGYACTATGVLDDASVRAIRQYQAAMVARTAAVSRDLVARVDGLISKGRDTDQLLFGDSPLAFKPMEAGSCKENKKASQAATATGQARTYWDNILAVWAAVSPYLPSGSSLSSGYRSFEDQVRVIEDFFTKTKDAGGLP